MAKPARARQGNAGLLLLISAAVLIGLLLLTQRAIAAQVGGLIAGLWVSTMGAVMSFIAAAVGG